MIHLSHNWNLAMRFIYAYGTITNNITHLSKPKRRRLDLKMGNCFFNALVTTKGLQDKYPKVQYMEGFANYCSTLHAWVYIPDEERHIDVTWPRRRRRTDVYMGVGFDPDDAIELMKGPHVQGNGLTTGSNSTALCNIDLITGKHEQYPYNQEAVREMEQWTRIFKQHTWGAKPRLGFGTHPGTTNDV
jgi:hypothetical protein